MAAFVWHDNIQIDFGNGVIAELPNDFDLVQRRLLRATKKLQEEIKGLNASDPNGNAKTLNSMLEALEDVFDAETVKRIFEGHRLSADNIVNVFCFTFEAVMQQSTGYLDAFQRLTETADGIKAKATGKKWQPREETRQAVLADMGQRLHESPPNGLRIPLANP